MKKVSWIMSVIEDGKFLRHSDSFAGELLTVFLQWQKNENLSKNEPWLKLLEDHVEKHKDKTPENYIFETIFNENLELDYDFCKDLKLFDTIEIDCFTPKSELGTAIIELVCRASLIFMVSHRSFEDRESLSLLFEVCREDYKWDMRDILNGISNE